MEKKIALILSCIFLIGFVKEMNAQHKASDSLQLKHVANAKPMNVIFILTDDHRYDFMGFTGKVPWLQTPHLDEMARSGLYFKNAFVSTSLCSPSRATILTGRYAHEHTIVDNASPEPDRLVYFPQYLQKAGYQTAFFGKWHMGEDDDHPRPGFNYWESFIGQGVYYNPTININGKRIRYTDSSYITEILTRDAIQWLSKRNKQQPFFLYLSHKAIHSEFYPQKKYAGMYACKKYPLPVTYYQTASDDYKKYNWPEWVKQQRYSWHGVDYMYHQHLSLDEMVQRYCETLMSVDESVGAIFDYLKQEGLDKNTIVIYMGDNGFSWGEHGLIDKRHFYEESVKVPFLMYYPGLQNAGTTVTKMVQNIDVAPTILQTAGLQPPSYMPGKSILPLLRGDSARWRDTIFYEYYWEYDFPMTPTVFGVRTEHFKYMHYQGVWDANELYDIQNDPNETINLIEKPEYQQTVKQLANALYNWLDSTNGMQIPLKKTLRHAPGDYKHPTQY